MVSQAHPADYPLMLEDCAARWERLSPDDQTFILALRANVALGHQLTAGQKTSLDDIWERATARG